MSSNMNKYYKNHIINSNNNEPSLNTPPIFDLYNIENGNKKSCFDWNIDLLSSTARTSTSTEIQSVVTTAEHQIPTITTIDDLLPELSTMSEDIITRCSEQESFHLQSEMTSIVFMDEVGEPEPTLEEFIRRGIEYENHLDPMVEQTIDQDASIIIDTSTTANENTRELEDTSSIDYLFVPSPSSSHETRQNTSANTEIRPSNDVIPYGHFLHPIAPKMRIRYEKELANNKFTAKLGYIRDCFLERPIYIGPYILFANYHIEITLLSTTPDGGIIYSFNKFYSPDKPDEQKFSNQIYLSPDQLEIENGYIKFDSQIAKTRQDDFPQASAKRYPWKKTSACIIKYYLSGEKKSVNLTPRQLNKNYHLDTMFLGVRRAQLKPNGTSYLVDPASPIIYSNRFTGVDSDDSPTTWNLKEHKLNILETKIINEGVSMHRSSSCKLEFILQILELYHCTLKSGSKQLEIRLMTDENLSQIYKIAFEEIIENVLYLPVNNSLINVPLTIVKGTLLDQDQAQNGVWLEPLLEQVDSTGCNHFHVEFCLQDVDTTRRRSYPYSNVNSAEFIDINMSINIQQISSSENDELQHNDNVMHDMADKRQHDDDDGNMGETLPVTKIRKTNDE